MFKKGDFVRVSDSGDKNLGYDSREFRGKEGVICNVNKDFDYPYEIAFFDKDIQQKNNDWGWPGWKENELEPIY